MLTFGLKAPVQFTDADNLRRSWAVSDDAGFDSAWVFDHFAPMGPVRTGDVFEAWTLLGAMAQATRRLRIGCMVTGNTNRPPGFLAKMAATVDHLSGGRLEFGFGAGGDDYVDQMFGRPLRPPAERIERWAEACGILRLLWTEATTTYHGKHYRLEAATSDPKPVQRPGPPMWLGSSGERLGLRVVAEFADVWVSAAMPGTPVAEAARLSTVLDRHCADIGRDPRTIRRAAQFWLPDTEADALSLVGEYVRAGFTDFVFIGRPTGPAAVQWAEQTAALLPKLRDLG
jgi:alkanesulfonate monooxygenase SsuD/methylene tetrahydromethanopterin reductase-like flavin-dependent oxidoreductase (luciferase family)